MRTVVLTLSLLIVAARPAAADEAKDLVNNAIRATAGSDLRLNRLATVVRNERGTFFIPTGDQPAQRTTSIALPDRIKFDGTVTMAGGPQPVVMAVDGVRGWKRMGPALDDLPANEYDAVKSDLDAWAVGTLLALRQKGVTLKLVPPITIDRKPSKGVSLSRPDQPDAQIYFAADTGLPSKVRIKLRQGSFEAPREIDLAGYRDFDGIKLPTKMTVLLRGKKTEEWTVDSYHTPDRFDDKVFAKPR